MSPSESPTAGRASLFPHAGRPSFLSIPVLILPTRILQGFFCVGHGGRDHVPPAGPFSQIYGSTAWAAERELRHAVLYLFFADRTPKLDRAFARHERSLGCVGADASSAPRAKPASDYRLHPSFLHPKRALLPGRNRALR